MCDKVCGILEHTLDTETYHSSIFADVCAFAYAM